MPDPTPETFAAWNEDMARRHDPDLYHTQAPLLVRLLERRRVHVLLELLDARPNHRVLEVGCGAGNVLERVAARERVGIDLSDYLLGKARTRLGPSVTLHRMNAEALLFEDASFDRVYCTEVLEHVLDPHQVLAEIRRVLRPNGIAVVSVPNEALINQVKQVAFRIPGVRFAVDRSGYEMADHMEDEWHLHAFDRAMLTRTASDLFLVDTLRGIPTRRLPIRWVARLLPLS